MKKTAQENQKDETEEGIVRTGRIPWNHPDAPDEKLIRNMVAGIKKILEKNPDNVRARENLHKYESFLALHY